MSIYKCVDFETALVCSKGYITCTIKSPIPTPCWEQHLSENISPSEIFYPKILHISIKLIFFFIVELTFLTR